MFELLFLMGFTLHNIEEGLWLPDWSKYAGKYHPKVQNNEFRFALIVITTVGYFLTFLDFYFGQSMEIMRYIYLGFVLMMALNSVFPHLIATIVLRRYAPGTLTGLMLNLPIGLAVVMNNLNGGAEFYKVAIGLLAVVTITGASKAHCRMGINLEINKINQAIC